MKISTDKKSISRYIAVFLTLSAVILFYFLLTNMKGFGNGYSKIITVLMPFLYGFVIAYILNYPYVWFEKIFSSKLKKGRKLLSLILTYILFFLITTVFLYIVVPQLVTALIGLIDTLPVYMENLRYSFEVFLTKYLLKFNMSSQDISSILNSVTDNLFMDFSVKSFMMNIVDILIKTSVGVKNIVMGIIISIYYLLDKDRFLKTGRKLVYCFLRKSRADRLIDVLRFTDKTFGGFIISKVIDSIIIGLICYIGMRILRLDYAVLISVIVGVTNIIPFFGPFIGGIPSALLLLLINPWQALIFGIFVVVLQQFDGNILGPKLSGDSIGIRAFYVVFAVIVGGGFFGVVGMFVGVPLFAVVYSLLSNYVNKILTKKGISVD